MRDKFPKVTIAVQIETCAKCPYVQTVGTIGAGFADDYHCGYGAGNYLSEDEKRALPKVMHYVETSRDEKPVPDWCPIKLNGNAETIAALLQTNIQKDNNEN